MAGPVASAAMSERERQRRLKELRRQEREALARKRYYDKGGRPAPTRRPPKQGDAQADLKYRPAQKQGPPRPGVPEGDYGPPGAKTAAARAGPRRAPRPNTALAGALGRQPLPRARRESPLSGMLAQRRGRARVPRGWPAGQPRRRPTSGRRS